MINLIYNMTNSTDERSECARIEEDTRRKKVMNIRDFEYFNTLGDLRSFTQTANAFHVSQPTISYAIKRLEEYYECDLIKKDDAHRSVLLTKEGRILKSHVLTILDEMIVIERAIERSKKNQINIGFPPIIRAIIFSQLLNKEEAISFISNFHLISGGSSKLLKKLLAGQLDFSLIGSISPLSHPDLTIKLLDKREFYIFTSKDNPLAQKTELSFKETLNYPFILLEEGYVHTKAFENLNNKYQKRAKTLLHFSDVQTIGQLVQSNIGITLMTDFIPFQGMEGLVKIPLIKEDKEIFYVQYAYLKNTVMTEDLNALISILDNLSKLNK